MKKNSYCMLAALFTLLFSNLSFAVDVDPCASWPVTLEEDADGFYEIGSADALYKFACMVNNGATNISGKLTADICLNACDENESVLKADGTLSDDASNFAQWTPIGTDEHPYTGTFDGNGHTIRGLYFNDESTEYVGLFGCISGSTAKVQNVGVVDSYFKGSQYVGGVVGYSFNGTVSNVYNTGSVSGRYSYVGGVVGYNFFGTVSNVYNTGSVSGDPEVGGVVGYNDGTVSNVYNTGIVSGNGSVGGVVGANHGTVSNVYNTGSVSGSGYDVGGVVGYNGSTVRNGFFNEEYYPGNAIGGGSGTADKVKGLFNLTDLANLTVGNRGDFPLLKGEMESPWAKGIYYDKATGKLANSELPYLKSLPKPQDVEMEFNVKDNVIQISSTDDLKNFAKLVNEYHITDVDAELTTNLTVNSNLLGENNANVDAETGEYKGNAPANVWTPIGTDEHPYTGTFDGNGHTIRGLYFNNENTRYVGLFGYIGSNGVVQNVGVVDSYILGEQEVGGIVGRNGGSVIGVYNKGTVGATYYAGGVVGANYGTLNIAYNSGFVYSPRNTGEGFGGVVGTNYFGTVENVYNEGSVNGWDCVGGIAGGNRGSVSNVYNTGLVGIGNKRPTMAAVAACNADEASVSNAYYISCENCSDKYGSGKTAAQLAALTIGSAANNNADLPLLKGESESPWEKVAVYDKATGKLTSTLPYLKNFPVVPDAETILSFTVASGVIQISTADDLKNFAKLVNEYHITDANAELTTSITLNSNLLGENNANVDAETGEYKGSAPANVWTPIGTMDNQYTGKFDGKGYTVSGLYFNDKNTNYVGLFGYIDGSAKVQNVGVVDSYFKGNDAVGGVVGDNYGGTVSNVYNTGSVSGSGDDVGGVVGFNDGTVSNAYNTGFVNGTKYDVGGVVGTNDNGTVSNAYNTGSVSGSGYDVGGVVGYNGEGTVSNAYNTGSVSGSGDDVGGVVGFNDGTVSNVYNTGSVSGYSEVGGVVGSNYGTVSNAYYNTEVTCENCSVVEGSTGKSSAEFTDGTVAKLLHAWCEMDGETCKEGGLNGAIWGQDLTAENSLPDFSGVVFEKRGSVTFFNLIDGVADSAYVNATASDAVAFWDTVTVDGPIKFMRSFTFVNGTDAYSTIMLPFNPESLPEGVSFYAFNGVSTGEGEWTVDMTSVEKVSANTPYLVKVTSDVSSITFEGGEFVATNVPHVVNVENWNFVGTYEYKSWEEGDEGLGSTYGFAANDGVNDPSIVGQFAKIGAGAYIYPMRAYLEYTAPVVLARPAANGAARAFAANTVASLPETINVVIVDKDEKTGEQTTKVIGSLNTRTGEIKFANDRWFDLNGRYLGNKKPMQKGAYYNNGKKVIVK